MEKNLKSKPGYEFFDLPKDNQTDEEIKKTIYYKAFKLAFNESRTRSKTETKSKIPFWFFTPLDNDSPSQPIATIIPSGNTTILTGTLPINTEGEVTHIGVDYLTTNGNNDLAFNILRDNIIISTMSQKYLFQSFPNLIPLKLRLPANKTAIKVIVYNNSTITTHRVKMVITGYYWYLDDGGKRK